MINRTAYVIGSIDFGRKKFVANGICSDVDEADEYLYNEFGLRMLVTVPYTVLQTTKMEFVVFIGDFEFHSTSFNELRYRSKLGSEEFKVHSIQEYTECPTENKPFMWLSMFEGYITDMLRRRKCD